MSKANGPVFLVSAIVVASFPYALYAEYQSRTLRTWTLVKCAIVKDDRVREGQSVRLTLRGATDIQVTEWNDQCDIPVGTEFSSRIGSAICTGRHAETCFVIESEAKR